MKKYTYTDHGFDIAFINGDYRLPNLCRATDALCRGREFIP